MNKTKTQSADKTKKATHEPDPLPPERKPLPPKPTPLPLPPRPEPKPMPAPKPKRKLNVSAKATASKKSLTKHWRVTDIQFDSEGRILISHPKLATIVKQQIKRGKHIYLSSANSGNYCVVVSQPCNAIEII
jgi:hypothetical protein